jgi:hypothetical protein
MCVCKVTNGDAPNAKYSLYNVCFRSFKTPISSLRKLLSPKHLIKELNCFDSNLKLEVSNQSNKNHQDLTSVAPKNPYDISVQKIDHDVVLLKKNHACFDYTPSSNIGISFMGF